MRKIGFDTIITKSLDRTVLILFKPFSLKKWLKLLFIAFLAGALTSGGSFGGGNYPRTRDSEAAIQDNSIFTNDHGTSGQRLEDLDLDLSLEEKGRISYISDEDEGFLGKDKKVWLGIGAVLLIPAVILIILLIILFAWLGARFRFVWFNSIVENVDDIGEPFNGYSREGNSLFKFYMVLLPIMLAFFAIVALTVFLPLKGMGVFDSNFQGSAFKVLGALIIPLLIFIGGIILLIIINVCIDHFVVTIMAMDRCSFVEGWRKFTAVFKQNVKDFVIYFLLLLGLGIISLIITATIAIIIILIAFLLALIIFGIPYFLLVSLLSLEIVFLIFAMMLGIPFLLVFFLITLSIGLPFAVFFRSFSFYFISSLQAGYTPLVFEDAKGE